MKRKRIIRVLALLLMLLSADIFALAAPGYEEVASYSETAAAKDVGSYGMVPISGEYVEDGTYIVKTQCSSSFFRILEVKLTVKDGEMEAVLTMSSRSYLFVYMGTPKEAAKADFEDYIPLEEGDRNTFTIPVEALNAGLECAAFSRNREKWYGRKVLFEAASLPAEALKIDLPDYERIDDAIDLYDKTNGTDSRAEMIGEDETEPAEDMGSAEPVGMEEDDGEYSIDVIMTGGSGRASVTSPTWLYVKDGKGYAKLLWSSSYYDYMIVGGEMYLNETTDGSNSTFTIPITALDEPMNVIADTTAMGDPLEIEYTLTFYSDTIGGKGRVPQEATKTVLIIAVIVIAALGVTNHFVKRAKRRGKKATAK